MTSFCEAYILFKKTAISLKTHGKNRILNPIKTIFHDTKQSIRNLNRIQLRIRKQQIRPSQTRCSISEAVSPTHLVKKQPIMNEELEIAIRELIDQKLSEHLDDYEHKEKPARIEEIEQE